MWGRDVVMPLRSGASGRSVACGGTPPHAAATRPPAAECLWEWFRQRPAGSNSASGNVVDQHAPGITVCQASGARGGTDFLHIQPNGACRQIASRQALVAPHLGDLWVILRSLCNDGRDDEHQLGRYGRSVTTEVNPCPTLRRTTADRLIGGSGWGADPQPAGVAIPLFRRAGMSLDER
jgi:hypothetical protein